MVIADRERPGPEGAGAAGSAGGAASRFLSRAAAPASIARAFRRAHAAGRLAHAYLLTGPAGSGRSRFAYDLARALFCGTGEPCGECTPCRAIAHDNHPGVTVFRSGTSRPTMDIAEVRELARLDHRRHRDMRVWIIEHCERLAPAAANALLKTLEEPSDRTLLLLLAPSAGSILPTIVSRCQRVPFPVRRSPGGAAGRGDAGGTGEGTGEGTDEGGEARVRLDLLGEASRPGFHAEREPREWLAGVVPGDGSPRETLALLLDHLIGRLRRLWKERERAVPGEASAELQTLERLLALRADVDANLNVDLLLDALCRELRRPRTARLVSAGLAARRGS